MLVKIYLGGNFGFDFIRNKIGRQRQAIIINWYSKYLPHISLYPSLSILSVNNKVGIRKPNIIPRVFDKAQIEVARTRSY